MQAYSTVVGWAEAPWEHVHFSERRDGVYVNPLRPGALGPFADTTRPRVKQLRAEWTAVIVPAHAARDVDLVVEAYDETPIRVPGPLGRQARHARAASLARDERRRQSCGALAHGDRPPAHDARGRASSRRQYGRWTRQNKQQPHGRYRFVLAAAGTADPADGRYVVEVAASDVTGNTTVARFPIRVANRGAPWTATAVILESPASVRAPSALANRLAIRDRPC